MLKEGYKCFFIAIVILFSVILLSSIFYHEKPHIKQYPKENGTISVFFCPKDDCEKQLIHRIQDANISIHCAFYDINLKSVIQLLEQKQKQNIDIELIIDSDNKDAVQYLSFVHFDDRTAYMHNKFCIFDGNSIMTGSMNPTYNGVAENANNLVFIESQYLALNYESEFQSLYSGNYGYDDSVLYPKILFNDYYIENYFCPEDNCEQHIIEVLSAANASIYFMQFSFTSENIGNIIIEKANKSVDVKGIFEKQQNSKWNQYQRFYDTGINVSFAANSGKLHHKVFIIDNMVVIFGSMNPSKNGNTKNDENIIIIHNEEIAKQFQAEFEKIIG